MELDKQNTPQKLTQNFFINYQNQTQTSISPCQANKMTPKCFKKSVNPRTPKTQQSISYSVAASSSMVSSNNSAIHSISMSVVRTPPAKRYHRIKNPFETALAERLHLPLIASPSLFQRPNTPQLSSTQFEWTIDEVSSLKPVNVEAHETQFQDSPDPDLEAKAQLAISSYFKEQLIVPSPIDCPLRSQRIILSEISDNTPISKPGRRIRDCSSQTELTLPPILPAALEEALKPYFRPHLANTDQELMISSDISKCSQVKDTSLRRKLFDMHNIVVLENETQKTHLQQESKTSNNSANSNSSPISINSLQHTAIIGKLSDSLDKSSFGSLSPISAADSLSPNGITASATKRKTRFGNFLSEVAVELPSPIHPPARSKATTERYGSQYRNNNNDVSNIDITRNNMSNEENESFTPERSSSPLTNMQNNNDLAEFSTDSFNIKVSRLKVNLSQTQANGQERIKKTDQQKHMEIDVFQADDTEDMLENTVDMDEMQISQMSTHSSNCSSTQSDTPRGKRRSASRKNLSQSFTASWLEDEDEQEPENLHSMKIKEILAHKNTNSANSINQTASSLDEVSNHLYINTTPKKNLGFYRTDSGFNEMSQNSLTTSEAAIKSQDVQQLVLEQQEVLVCCSTPSSKNNCNFIS